MAAYLIVRVDVTDPNKYAQYIKAAPPAVEKYGGKYIARAGETITLEGPEENRRIVLMEFPTMEKAKEFYDCPEYQEARKLRQDAAIGQLIVVDGVPSTI